MSGGRSAHSNNQSWQDEGSSPQNTKPQRTLVEGAGADCGAHCGLCQWGEAAFNNFSKVPDETFHPHSLPEGRSADGQFPYPSAFTSPKFLWPMLVCTRIYVTQ